MTLEEKMRVGYIVEDYNNWNFFKEIADNLSTRYSTNIFVPPNMSFPIFRERINRSLFQYKIKSFIKENQVVFFEWVGPYLAEISKHTNSCFLITRLHSYELYEWAPLVNWRNVDKIIFISRAMQQKFIEIYPEVADKTIVIYHGVNLNKFQPPKQRLYQGRIGMMGKITPIKRCYEMILALYEVKILGANFHLDLAGPPGIGADFRYTASIKSLIKKLNLTTSVTLGICT